MPSVRSGLPWATYTVPDSTSFYPYDAGRFHPQLGLSHVSAYPRHGRLPYDKELMQWREYPPFCTDTITKRGSYCQQLFFAFYLPFSGLVGGMPTVSRGPVPRDRYRVSYLTGFVKYFFYFFLLFSFGCRRGMPGISSLPSLPGTLGGVARWGLWTAGSLRSQE